MHSDKAADATAAKLAQALRDNLRRRKPMQASPDPKPPIPGAT